MLYNINKHTIKHSIDCLTCEHFNKKSKTCNGVGKVCFEFDQKTQTILDPITKLPIKL